MNINSTKPYTSYPSDNSLDPTKMLVNLVNPASEFTAIKIDPTDVKDFGLSTTDNAAIYLPTAVATSTNTTSSNNLNELLSSLGTISFSLVGLELIVIISTQQGTINSDLNYQDEVLESMNKIVAALAYIATQMKNTIAKNEAEIAKTSTKNTKKSGIAGLFSHLVEVLNGLFNVLKSGGTDVTGYLMVLDGLVRVAADLTMVLDPKYAENNDWCQYLQQDGMFGVLDFIDPNAGAYAALAMSILMTGACLASSGVGSCSSASDLSSNGASFTRIANLGANSLSFANSAASLAGLSKNLVSAINSKNTNDSSSSIGGSDVLGMGLYAWSSYKISDASGLNGELNKKYGAMATMIIELALCTITQTVINYGVSSYALRTNADNRARTNMNGENTDLSKTQLRLRRIQNVLQKLSGVLSSYSSMVQLSSSSLKATSAWLQAKITIIEAKIQLAGTNLSAEKTNLSSYYNVRATIQSEVQGTDDEIATIMQQTISEIQSIFAGESRST